MAGRRTSSNRTLDVATRLVRLPSVGSRDLAEKAQEVARKGVDVLPLHPYPVRGLPEHVVEAARRAMIENHEPPSRGLPRLCQTIAEGVGAEIGRPLDPEAEVLITNGGMQALNVVFRTLLNPGDEVIIPSPCYFFQGCVRLAEGVPVHVPMAEGDGYAWDLDAIEAAITPRTKVLVLNTPVNPTGYVLSEEDVRTLGGLALRHGLLVVTDESYENLVYDGQKLASIAYLPDLAPNTILIRSFTKSYAMPGWRVGYIVAAQTLVDAFTKALEWEVLHCSTVSQAAAAAAMAGPQDWLSGVAQEFEDLRDHFLAGLGATAGLSCVKPAGGPFFFLNVQQLFPSSQAASEALLEVGIPTTPGWHCQSDSHVRLAFGARRETLEEVLLRLTEVVRGRLGSRGNTDRG